MKTTLVLFFLISTLVVADFGWKLCALNTPFNVTTVSVKPENPKKGQNVTATVAGTLTRDVNGGILEAIIHYRGIRLKKIQYPLCEAIRGGCPVKQGPISTSATAELPKAAPSGRYTVKATAVDEKKQLLACVDVWFDLEKLNLK